MSRKLVLSSFLDTLFSIWKIFICSGPLFGLKQSDLVVDSPSQRDFPQKTQGVLAVSVLLKDFFPKNAGRFGRERASQGLFPQKRRAFWP
jgi:hypothetical protein